MPELYDSLDMSDLTEEFNRLSNKNTGGNSILDKFVMMPKEGPFVVRLLPPAKGKKFYCATRIHKLVMPNGQKKNIHCTKNLKVVNGQRKWLDDNFKDPCPICKYYYDLYNKSDALKRNGDKAGAEGLVKQAKAIKPMERYYYNCIIRQQINPKTGELEKNIGPKILSIGISLHKKIFFALLGDLENDEKPLGNVADPKTGMDFKIIKRLKPGEDQFPEYNDSKFLDSSVLSNDKALINKWMEGLHDLAELRRLLPHPEMKVLLNKYLGKIPMNDDDEDDVDFEAPETNTPTQKTKQDVVVEEVKRDMGLDSDDISDMSDDEFFKKIQDLV